MQCLGPTNLGNELPHGRGVDDENGEADAQLPTKRSLSEGGEMRRRAPRQENGSWSRSSRPCMKVMVMRGAPG